VNYPAMRYVASEDCKVKGPARALLWVIAYHADRDTGECWLGQRRLARESGVARSTVQRALDDLFSDGVLEYVEDHRGPKPDRYQIAPGLIEGIASASGLIEGTASGSGMVEGQAVSAKLSTTPRLVDSLSVHYRVRLSGYWTNRGALVDRSAASNSILWTDPRKLLDRQQVL
jgi:DNA-binding transcriptional MocR family regulator